MKQKRLLLLPILCLLLGGCGLWMNRNYVSVTPHQDEVVRNETENISAKTYPELREALKNMVKSGTETGVISVAEYKKNHLIWDLQTVITYITTSDPIGTYAVNQINYEIGTNSGIPAVAVEIDYHHDRSEIQKIIQVHNDQEANKVIYRALDQCKSGLVLQIASHEQTDFGLVVENYALQNPNQVMEIPSVSVTFYPDTGAANQIAEIKFEYQISREVLLDMQKQVQPVFAASELYVSGDGADREKLDQLYSFLMERFNYEIATSITPAYSLLRHGVGDSKAFAMVYGAMCREAGLECYMVSGTRDGEPWFWNIVRDGKQYYHLDLLQSLYSGGFQERADREMKKYVWDYSRYPECPHSPLDVEITPPSEAQTETTKPES